MKRMNDESDPIDSCITQIIDDIKNKKDVSVRVIELNKRYGIASIVDWIEDKYDGSTDHEILSRILYDYTKGYSTTEYKGRLIALWDKWKK